MPTPVALGPYWGLHLIATALEHKLESELTEEKRMKMRFKDPRHREIVKMLGFSDEAINCLLDSKNLTHEGARFANESVVLRFKPRCFEEVARYQPDKWNPFPEVTPPAEGEYIVTIRYEGKLVTSSKYWTGDFWVRFHDDIVAFRALPEPYESAEDGV